MKDFIVKSLNRIKEYEAKNDEAEKLGINLLDYYSPLVSCLVESICYLISGSDDKKFECTLDLVDWWLYDQPDKIIYLENGKEIDINLTTEFVNYLVKELT